MKNKLLLLLGIFLSLQSAANNMLVQNVTTTGNNAAAKTIQVQFDMSWDNSWRDGLNWDAAWVFIKFKDANGLWQHAQLNQTGFANGSGTANTVKVTSDKVGCWVYRSALGSGTFNATGMQLQWNYGLNGLNDVTGLEVRVFSTEMVYVPEGEFNCAGRSEFGSKSFWYFTSGSSVMYADFYSPGNNFPVINKKLSPMIIYSDYFNSSWDTSRIRIRGDVGIDTNNDGLIDNLTYPTGFKAFYCYKYELTEQQFSDFLNTLSQAQALNIGIPSSTITVNNNEFFSSAPNKPCGGSDSDKLFAYADWAGLRPISFLEFNKASYGPEQPIYNKQQFFESNWGDVRFYGYPAWRTSNTKPNGFLFGSIRDVGVSANATSSRENAGSSFYGILDLTGNLREPTIGFGNFNFDNSNGDGKLSASGFSNLPIWQSNFKLLYIDQCRSCRWLQSFLGFRYCRSAE